MTREAAGEPWWIVDRRRPWIRTSAAVGVALAVANVIWLVVNGFVWWRLAALVFWLVFSGIYGVSWVYHHERARNQLTTARESDPSSPPRLRIGS